LWARSSPQAACQSRPPARPPAARARPASSMCTWYSATWLTAGCTTATASGEWPGLGDRARLCLKKKKKFFLAGHGGSHFQSSSTSSNSQKMPRMFQEAAPAPVLLQGLRPMDPRPALRPGPRSLPNPGFLANHRSWLAPLQAAPPPPPGRPPRASPQHPPRPGPAPVCSRRTWWSRLAAAAS
uniref:Uncharacterized protein n=1 Tax=Macaca fascicularis TaxID=9541 RepID=A0A7N9CRN1_MACFA